MATRAHEVLQNALIDTFTVVSGGAATLGYPVKLDTTDAQVTNVTATTDEAIGIALNTAVAGAECRVARIGSNGICKAKVGTNGATMGKFARYDSGGSDGCTDATIGTGTTAIIIVGQFLQTGTSADLVGLNLGPGGPCVGA